MAAFSSYQNDASHSAGANGLFVFGFALRSQMVDCFLSPWLSFGPLALQKFMELDTDKIDDEVLALLFLTAFQQKKDLPWRTWKGHDWEVMNRLCEKGYISDPKSNAKSVILTDTGYAKAKQLFETRYAKKS